MLIGGKRMEYRNEECKNEADMDEEKSEINETELLRESEDMEEEKDESTGTILLKKPLMVDGEQVHSIAYDFNSVKPIQYINLVKRTSKKEGTISLPELNMTVQLGLFALASGISVSDLKRIDYLPDYTTVCRSSRDFLLQDSEDQEDL